MKFSGKLNIYATIAILLEDIISTAIDRKQMIALGVERAIGFSMK
ncbi:MAG: hypothetical protein V1874_16215 [Spirochaetota bacterium]